MDNVLPAGHQSAKLGYLQSLRTESCYLTVRKVHNFLVTLAWIGTALALISMLWEASKAPYGHRGDAYALAWGIAAAVAVGIFIERALFVAILDAVDVFIDNAALTDQQRDKRRDVLAVNAAMTDQRKDFRRTQREELRRQRDLRWNTTRLTTLSQSDAEVVVQGRSAVYLNGLTTLSPEAATVLAQHTNVVYLYINGLTTLSPETAEALARRTNWTSLNGLTTLSDEAAQALAQCQGRVFLRGLTTLSNDAFKALQANRKIYLPSQFRQ